MSRVRARCVQHKISVCPSSYNCGSRQARFRRHGRCLTDFIKDVFFRNESIGLRSVDVGEFTVWFEEGPIATIAVVIRGEPQPVLRNRLQVASEKLHSRFENALSAILKRKVLDRTGLGGEFDVNFDGYQTSALPAMLRISDRSTGSVNLSLPQSKNSSV